jgi:hypothetical protein
MGDDIHAEMSRFWQGASVIHERIHRGRKLTVYESAVVDERPPSFIVVLNDGERFEGWLVLSPEGSVPRIHGPLTTRDHESYNVRLDSFAGGPLELADLACRLLDYDYKFPPEAGATPVNWVWTEKPPPYRPSGK